MKQSSWIKYGLLLLGVLFTQQACVNNNTNQICQIEGDEMILKVEKNWSQETWDSISKVYDLPRTLLDSITRFDALGPLKAQGWSLMEKTRDMVFLLRPMRDMVGLLDPMNLISIHGKDGKVVPGYPFAMPVPAIYGINYLSNTVTGELKDGRTRFFLAGHLEAKAVYLSGSFNSWSTLATPMQRNSEGWYADISLHAGKYIYRFIIDGEWIEDPANLQHEPNEFNAFNSVYFRTNQSFSLKGFSDARKVVLTGAFNDWNEQELKMQRTDGGWGLKIYMKEGIYAYKFKVDDKWYLDPSNPNTEAGGKGSDNSLIGVGDTTFFRLKGFKDARSVRLAGDFNGWNPGSLSMRRSAEGWELPFILPPGNHMYKFIVDGNWITDPINPHEIYVGDGLNSVMAVNPNKTFTLKGFTNAQKVILSGSFNDWNESGYTLRKSADGWKISLYLPPGKHLYKFIIDGNWSLDPSNQLWEENEHGTGNSVLWIEPTLN